MSLFFKKSVQHLSIVVLRYHYGIDLPIAPQLYPRCQNATHDGGGWCEFQKKVDDFGPAHSEQPCSHANLPKCGASDGRMLNFGSRDYGRRDSGDQKLRRAVREGRSDQTSVTGPACVKTPTSNL